MKVFLFVMLLWPAISMGAGQKYPDVIDAKYTNQGSTYRFAVTISSPYDSPSRYADAYRILDEQGNELGVRILWHDHANEQPFTRSLDGVKIPDGVHTITIQGRDKVYGWGGGTFTLDLLEQ